MYEWGMKDGVLWMLEVMVLEGEMNINVFLSLVEGWGGFDDW